MASTTSLLRTQKTRQQTIWNQQDQLVDYEWSMSDKSTEAYNQYIAHYAGRMTDPQSDPAKALTYQKRIDAGRKAYTSNEIQRASIDVIEGRQSEDYKIGVLENLYVQAYENGDMDLAQGLRLQIDNQYVQQQNRQLLQMAAYGGGGGGGADQATKDYLANLSARTADLKDGNFEIAPGFTANDFNTVMAERGIPAAMTLFDGYVDDTKKMEWFGTTDVTPTQVAYGFAKGGYDALAAEIAQIPDEAERAKRMSDLNKQMATEKIGLGGSSFTLAQLEQAAIDEANGNPSIEYRDGKFVGRPVINYQLVYDEQGNPGQTVTGESVQKIYGDMSAGAKNLGYPTGTDVVYTNRDGYLEVVPYDKAYNTDGSLLSEVKGALSKAKSKITGQKFYTADQIVESAGFKKVNGNFIVNDAALQERLNRMGISPQDIPADKVTINPDGQIEFMADNKLVRLTKDPTDNFYQVYEVKAQSGTQFVGGRQIAPTTSSTLNAANMYRDLQTNASAGMLQGADTARYLQATGGNASQILRGTQAVGNLNQMNAQALLGQQQLQVQQKQAPSISVQPYTAPVTPIKVSTNIYQPQLAVKTPVTPTLAVKPVAPSAPVKPGTLSLQGGTGYLQGGTGKLQGSNPFSGTLKVQ